MEWSLGFAALPLVGGLCLLFRRRQQRLASKVTQQQVRCPLYKEEATIQVRTRQSPGQHSHYTDVSSCSLLCQGPFMVGTRMEWTPDMPYYAGHPLAQGEGPMYEAEVSCQKTCLSTLNYAEKADGWRERACMSGVVESTEFAQRVGCGKGHAASPLQAPWSYGV